MRSAGVNSYLREAANALLLRDWTVRYDPQEPGEEALAEVHTSEDTHIMVRFSAAFWDLDPAEQRDIVVHELCHVHLARLYDVAQHLVGPGVHHDACCAMVDDADDHATEVFARLLRDRVATPRWRCK